MAFTVAQFRLQRPEFKSIPDDAVIQAFLDDVAKELLVADFIVDAGLADEYQHYRAAHLLAVSPYAKSSRLVNEKGKTTYQGVYGEIWLRALTGL